MGQTIKVQRPVASASISGLYVILKAAFTIALLGVLLYKYICVCAKTPLVTEQWFDCCLF
jgi:hypothetical protein